MDKDYPLPKREIHSLLSSLKTLKKAKSEIYQKLSGLENPILFLKHVTSLRWNYGVEEHCFFGEEKTCFRKRVLNVSVLKFPKTKKREDLFVLSKSSYGRHENET
ncbi:MAG: hypothetical protein L6U16_07495 [Porphyromonadaceae bacterium]|nr:MAG: hypothetical protein L6U16_07495 [Porphyromonadaceae bacterium]